MTNAKWWLIRPFSFVKKESYRHPRYRKNSFRLALEQIEDRLVPSTITVTSPSDNISDTGSLRYTLSIANPGDTIDFTSDISFIDLTSGGLTISKNVSIIGDLCRHPVTIDGGGLFTVFTVNSGVVASLSGLTIADGATTDIDAGGGIANEGTLTVSNCSFSNNSACDGGAINNSGTLTVNNSTISDNSTMYDVVPLLTGGGYNMGGNGAGIYNSGTVSANDCIFRNNASISDGELYDDAGVNTGGGAIGNRGTLAVTNTTFDSNSAKYFGNGGGVYNFSNGTATIDSSTFSKNSATDSGGGITNQGTLSVDNSTFNGNSTVRSGATTDGGAVFNYTGSAVIDESTISGNIGSEGGGISTWAPLILHGDLIIGNINSNTSAPDDLFGGVWDNFTTYECTSSDNIVGTGVAPGDLQTPNENDYFIVPNYRNNRIDVGIAAVNLGPLADNGGLTETMALFPGSIAIDSGVTAYTATYDQRGVPRPIGSPNDVGAYQSYLCPSVTLNPSNQTILYAPKTQLAAVQPLAINGYDTSFSAGASGSPTPNVIWQVSTNHGKTFSNLAPGGVYGKSINSTTLTITGVTAAMQGFEYRAVFTNRASKATKIHTILSKTATLTVDAPANISNTVAGEKTNDLTAIRPFSLVKLTESGNPAELQSVSVALNDPLNGVLTNLSNGQFSNGIYTLNNATLAQAQAALRALVFVPTAHQVAPGSTVTTGFTIELTDIAGPTSNSKTTVVTTATKGASAHQVTTEYLPSDD